MKRIVVTSLGLLLAISAASPNCWAVDVNFTGASSTDFNTAANWTPATAPGTNPGDTNFVQNNLTSTYSAGTVVVGQLIVGNDSPGTLNMTAGDLRISSGGDGFEIGRSRIPGAATPGSFVDLSGTAILRANVDPVSGVFNATNSTVGDRDKGTLHIGPNAQVISPGSYWRVGNYGPSQDGLPPATELHGNGLLDVEGSFAARALFIGVSDGTGVVQVRGHGSVTLTQQNDNPGFADIDMDFNHSPIFQPNQSGTIHMLGSTVSMSASNLFSQHSAASPVKNLLWFTADAGGVSPITLSNSVNISNNALKVDLTGFSMAVGQSILLVDAAPGQIVGAPGTFASYTVNGIVNPSNFAVIYDVPNGNILLQSVPEPSTAVLLGLGMVVSIFAARRRESR